MPGSNNTAEDCWQEVSRKTGPKERLVIYGLLDQTTRGCDQRPSQAQLLRDWQDIAISPTGRQDHTNTSGFYHPHCLMSRRRHSVLTIGNGSVNIKNKQLNGDTHDRNNLQQTQALGNHGQKRWVRL
jgi:hypothetical protein